VREYLLTLVVAAAVTFLATPLMRRLAIRWGAMAVVRDRDVHAIPTPRLGGVAMLAGFGAALLVARQLPFLGDIFDQSRDARAVMSGAVIICALGILDDRYDLDAITKLAGQVLAAGVMAAQGIQMLWLPIGGAFLLGPVEGLVLTVIVVVVTINAVNFVDGLDGLAAGIVAIAGTAFFGFSYLLAIEKNLVRATTASLVTAALVGVCLGFLPHNFTPARIFMGDSGSMLLGLLLAASTISLTGGLDPNQVGKDVAPAFLPLLLPIAVLVVPLADLLLAVVRRTRAGRSPFAPDKQHLHHRLLEIGHSQARAVLIMYLWSAVLAFGATALAFLNPRELLVSFVLVVAVAALLTVNIPRLRAARRS
jgi:UDP-GlcNAc:undecaprenyl-phosphate GlcNAc-1-phosphate transferase